MLKRMISLLLAAVLLVGAVPAQTFAAETETSVDAGTMTVAGTNALGDLLTEEISASQNAKLAAVDGYDSGFSVTDLTFSGATATVTYDAVEEATLVVAVYTEDGLTLLNSAYKTVSPDATTATVTVSGEMPEFFAAAAYLLNSYDLAPLCAAYHTSLYTRSIQDLKNSTVEDFPEEKVLNLDGDNTTNFAVYAGTTVVIEPREGVNTVTRADEETMTYVIANADAQFTSLQAGDVVAYAYGDNQYLFAKVESVDVSGTTVTIQGGELELSDVFSHVKIEGDSANAEVTYDPSTLSEGLAVAGVSQAASSEVSGTGTVSQEFTVFDSGAVTGTLGFQVDVTLTFYAAEEHCFLELRDDFTVTLNATFEDEFSASKRLGNFGVAFAYGSIYVGLEPTVNFSAEAEAEFEGTITAMVGCQVDSVLGASSLSRSPVAKYDFRAEGSVYLGVDLNPTVELLGGYLADGDLTLAAGVRIDGELTGGITSGSTEEQEPEDTIHSCEVCIDLNGYCQLNFAAAVSFLKQDSLTFTLMDSQKDIHIGQWYYSLDHEEFDEGECPYKSHKVTVEVLDSDGAPVGGAAVEAKRSGEVQGNGFTNGSGIFVVYLEEGSHTIRAVSGELQRTTTAKVEEPRTVTITLPENPEEEAPEETTPMNPGGVLEGGESVPAMQPLQMTETGYLPENGMTWSIYRSEDWTSYKKIVIKGSGALTRSALEGAIAYSTKSDGTKVEYSFRITTFMDCNEVVLGEGITSVSGIRCAGGTMGTTSKVTSVSLPSTLQEIGDSFFAGSKITSVALPSGLTKLGGAVFADCYNLKSIVIPASVQEVGDALFAYSGVQNVVFQGGITKLGNQTFYCCNQLTSVQLPSTLKELGTYNYQHCANFRQIDLPEGLTDLGTGNFSHCGLSKVTIPSTVETIGKDAFQYAYHLADVTISEGVKNIKSGAFLYCEALTSIRIPGSVESVSQGAFSCCENLAEVEFAARSSEQSLTLGSGAFSGCTLKELRLPSVDSAWGYVVTVTDKIVLEGYVIPNFDGSSEEYGSGGPTFGSFSGTIYYPYELCVINMSDDNPINEAHFYTVERMRRMSPQATWVPYGVGEAGDMRPYESLAYCYYTDGINSPFDLPGETYANAAECAETVPAETEPAVTEPMETVPTETVEETFPAETAAETLPEETVEETVPVEAEAAETASFTTVALPTPAAANTFRVSAPAPSVRAMSSAEQTGQASAPAMASLYGGEYSSEVTENRTVKTASFSDLVPGKEYVLLALASLSAEDPLSAGNLVHIDQGMASAEGTLSFRYVERQSVSASYVMVSGPSDKDLADADITVPRLFANGEAQVIHPTVIYGGKILTENKDYVLSGKLSFTEAGEYTCYIRGIYDYTGVVQCTYTVEEMPGTQPPVERPPVETVKLFEGDTDLSKQAVWEKQLKKETANGFTVQLTAEVMPAEASQNLSWSSSDTSVAAVSSGKVTFTGKAGDVTITAEAKDGSGASAKVTYRVLAPVAIEPAGDSDIRLLGGKSTTLKVINQDTGKAVRAKDIVWTLDAGEQDPSAFASVSASGKLTTKKVVSRADLRVYGEVYSNGNYVDTVAYTVSVYPAVTQVEIFEGTETVNGKTIPVDTSGEVTLPELTAKVYPTDAMEAVTWKSSAKAIAEVDPVTGELTWKGKNGTVTVTATANDGSKKKATVKLTFGTLAEDLTIGIKNGKQITAAEEAEVISGKSLQLAAELTGSPTNKKVTWSLENTADSAYVKLSTSGKVTAKTVYEERTVVIRATAADGSGATDTFTVSVQPKDPEILVLRHSDRNVTGSTVYADLNRGGTVTLTAHDLTDGQIAEVEWKTSKTALATVEEGTVTFRNPGTVTVTATAADGRKATVAVKAAALASRVTVTGAAEVASGKSITLKASAENAAGSKVTWTVVKGGEYAKIAKNGKLTANKDITTAREVTVRATAADGSGVYGEMTVTVRPLAQGVQIYSIDEATGAVVLDVDSDDSGSIFGLVRSNTNFRWAVTTLAADGGYQEKLQLNANVYPWEADKAMNAIQGVTWKSSGKKVATVDENGLVTCLKPGTVTITATANDGSGKKATFRLTVVKKTAQILLEETYTVTAGKKLTLKPTLLAADGTAPVDKRVEYKITGGDGAAHASISQKGVLTTKKTGASTTVEVTVTALDGSGVSKTCTVYIQPA